MSQYNKVYDATCLIRERIKAAASRVGRNPNEVRLLAVTKFHPIEAITAAFDAGIRLFGENRVQEAERKFGRASGLDLNGYSLHMIGNLQSNKIAKAIDLFDAIESIGDLLTLERVMDLAARRGRQIGLFLELHTGESTKGGFETPEDLLKAVETFRRRTLDDTVVEANAGVSLQGIMTMAPFTANPEEVRTAFKKLANTREAILEIYPEITALDLSMGMSDDFELAIEEGSTLVRIGTAIFGEREYT